MNSCGSLRERSPLPYTPRLAAASSPSGISVRLQSPSPAAAFPAHACATTHASMGAHSGLASFIPPLCDDDPEPVNRALRYDTFRLNLCMLLGMSRPMSWVGFQLENGLG